MIGPGSPGHVRVRLGQRERDVPALNLPPSLRVPNAKFVAVIEGGEFVRVEPRGQVWRHAQELIRSVLNTNWDPVGVADEVADEYDNYIGAIYSLLYHGASAEDVAAHLCEIETDSMGLTDTDLSQAQRLEVARQLLSLDLPSVE